MILEVREIINIDSIATIRDKFQSIEHFTENELEETIMSEPHAIISKVATKAARVDSRYFVLLKTADSLLGLHLGINYFLIITEQGTKRVEVCLGKSHAEEKYINYVKQVAITWDVQKKYFTNEETVLTYEYCQRVAPSLKDHGFEIELIFTK